MGIGHSSPAYIPQTLIKNPIVINRSENPSSFVYNNQEEGFYVRRRMGGIGIPLILFPLLFIFFILFFLFKPG